MGELLNQLPEYVFMGSVVAFYVITAILVFLFFVSEITENGYLALASFVIFSIITAWLGNFNITNLITLEFIGLYLLLGLVHSILRTYFYGRARGIKKKNLSEDDKKSEYTLKFFDRETKNSLKGNVFRWWFLWPVSLLTWVFSDLLIDIWNYIYDNTKKMYEYILNLGFNSIK